MELENFNKFKKQGEAIFKKGELGLDMPSHIIQSEEDIMALNQNNIKFVNE